jgi:hypothetical protein
MMPSSLQRRQMIYNDKLQLSAYPHTPHYFLVRGAHERYLSRCGLCFYFQSQFRSWIRHLDAVAVDARDEIRV